MADRYVIYRNKSDVSILDTQDDENLEIFSIMCEDNEVISSIIVNELYDVVQLLNEQDKELKKQGIMFP